MAKTDGFFDFDFGLGDIIQAGAGLGAAKLTNRANIRIADADRRSTEKLAATADARTRGTDPEVSRTLNPQGGIDEAFVGAAKKRSENDFTRAIEAGKLIPGQDLEFGLGKVGSLSAAADESLARNQQLGDAKDSALKAAIRAGLGTNSGVQEAFARNAGRFAIDNQAINVPLRAKQIQEETAQAGQATLAQRLALLTPQQRFEGSNTGAQAAAALIGAGKSQPSPDFDNGALELAAIRDFAKGIGGRGAQKSADEAFRQAFLSLNQRTQGDQINNQLLPFDPNTANIPQLKFQLPA